MADATLPSGVNPSEAGLFLIQKATPLRDSLIYDLQTKFYSQLNIKAWSDSIVPNFVTSNAFIAHCYATVIFNFVVDWFSKPEADRTQPVYIVEVGAGHGRLAFLILRELLEMREHWPKMEVRGMAPFKLVITDFTEGNVDFWLQHECLKPFFDAGLADAAVWNAEKDATMMLRAGGETLGPDGSVANPIVGICNYIFDTLRQDAFRIVEGQLQIGLASVYSNVASDAQQNLSASSAGDKSEAGAAVIGMDVIRRMRLSWEYKPVTPEDVYPGDDDASVALRSMLAVYCLRCRSAAFTVPIGGLKATQHLAAMSKRSLDGKQKVLMLCGDKAYNHEEELLSQAGAVAAGGRAAVNPDGSSTSSSLLLRDPHVAVHGSFSLMVNFHAVRLYTLARGGFSLHTPQLDGFKVSAFVLGCCSSSLGHSGNEAAGALSPEQVSALSEVTVPQSALTCFPNLLCGWADSMDSFGPDNFATLQRCIKDEIPASTGVGNNNAVGISLKTALCTLRMSRWDPDVFFKFKPIFIEKVPSAPERLQQDIYLDLAKVASRYYPLQASKDIAFEVGRICMGIKRYGDAIALFQESIRQCGDHHVSRYNVGICEFYLSKFHEALSSFDASLALKPDYLDATNWRARVLAKLAGEDGQGQKQSEASVPAPGPDEGKPLAPAGSGSAAQSV